MLDHEPENTHDTTNDSGAPDTSPPKSPPRRRRAATRPAGPPTPVAEKAGDQPDEVSSRPDPCAEAAESALETKPSKPAKRTRRTTKTAAADGEETPARPRRSRKRAEPEPVTESPDAVPVTAAAAAAEEGTVAHAVVEALQHAVQPAPGRVEVPAAESAPEPAEEPAAESAPEPAEEPAAESAPEPAAETADEGASVSVQEPATPEDRTEDRTEESTEAPGDEDLADAEEPEESEDGAGGRRRRRRRGGRRRRRGNGEGDADDGGSGEGRSDAADDADSSSDDEGADSEADSEGDAEGGGRRRRRRRRRRGEDAVGAPDDPSEVVVRVREPRSRRSSDAVAGIDGSTRMEAKRQRRREGREAGRRRAPILSEAEFLARRESVGRKMIIRQRDDLSQIAVIEDEILVEHYVDRDSAASLIGNVYLGRVQNVLPSMEAAFIDIGRGRNAVLYAGEVDWASFGGEGQQRKIESVLKSGTTVLVQVTKDPVGAKGARLTNHVSIPGRYIVYAPGGHLSGISRKLPDVERKRLKAILSDLVPESASVIVRTAAEGASEDELVRDVNRLKAQWEDIERKVKAGSAPQLLYGEPDLTLRIVRDLFTEDFSDLIIQGTGSMSDAYDAVAGYVSHVAPHLEDRLRRWDVETDGDLFGAFRLDEQIAKGLERKVFLPSGGSLVIDRTEAMTVVDVNTGKFTGSGGNLEATVTSNNLEAAEEIVRQLRLRDIGGIIVIDFIDMVLPGNRELLLRRLVECLGRDRTRHQVAEVTSLGLVQMTRKKIGTGLLEAFSTECPHCGGRGYEIHELPVESQKQPDGGARDQRNRSRNERSGRGKIPPELKPDLTSAPAMDSAPDAESSQPDEESPNPEQGLVTAPAAR